MKKGVVIGVALIFSFVLVTGFVSAGFFDWITGNAVRAAEVNSLGEYTLKEQKITTIEYEGKNYNFLVKDTDAKINTAKILVETSGGTFVDPGELGLNVKVSEVRSKFTGPKTTFSVESATNGLMYEKSQIMGKVAFEELSSTDQSVYAYEEIQKLNAKMDYFWGIISSESSSKFAQFLPFTDVFFIEALGQKDSVGKIPTEPFEKIGQTVREDHLSKPISFSQAQVRLEKVGTPGAVTVTINLDASTLSTLLPGAQLATATISSNVVTGGSMNTYTFDFGETITFAPGVRYWIIVQTPFLNSENHYLLEKKNDDPYPRGSQNNYENNVWTASVDSDTGASGSVGGVVVTGSGFDLPGGGSITIVGGIEQGPDDIWVKLRGMTIAKKSPADQEA